jgi:hypothetical protein
LHTPSRRRRIVRLTRACCWWLVAGVALDRGGGCDVQAAQVPAHCDDGQHLRLLPGGSRLGL